MTNCRLASTQRCAAPARAPRTSRGGEGDAWGRFMGRFVGRFVDCFMGRFALRSAAGRLAGLLLALCVAGLTGGCSTPSFLKGDKVKWDQLTLMASDDVNNNSPVAVDVVFVTDDAMLARVAELPAAKWFAARADLASTFPKAIRYRSWELVPGQRIDVPGDDIDGPRVSAAFVFAGYPDPGAHRVRIEQFRGRLAVQLDNNTFSVSTVK